MSGVMIIQRLEILQNLVPIMSFGAVAGATPRGSCGPHIAARTTRRPCQRLWVSLLEFTVSTASREAIGGERGRSGKRRSRRRERSQAAGGRCDGNGIRMLELQRYQHHPQTSPSPIIGVCDDRDRFVGASASWPAILPVGAGVARAPTRPS